ncbi:MAG: murein biosynthesis integral membrane protein MurJ [Vicinamibacteria bacterium]
MSGEVKGGGAERGMMRAAGLISGLTLVSRVLGLVREQVFAALLGAGMHADAFQIAFRIPNLLRDLFAEGALSAAFVPTYAAALARGGPEEAHRLARRLVSALGVLLAILVTLGIAFAGPIVELLAPGYGGVAGKTELTVMLTRVMMPFLPLVSLAAVAMGMLNAQERFGAPALAPAMFNVVSVTWGFGLWLLGFDARAVVVGWAIGTLLGGLAQLVAQLPSLRRDGFRLGWDWAPRDPGLLRIAALMGPATVGLAAVQINIFISSRFASHEPGAVSWLMYAFRVLYLPIGIFGVALGTVAAVGLARSAAVDDGEGMRRTLRRALRMLLFLSVPATAGLWALGVPVVRLLFERGRFGAHDTEGTAAALAYYSTGLVAYTGVKVLAPAFYALGRPRVPLLGSALAVATNLLVILALQPRFGFRMVALGTALGSLLNAALLVLAFERRVGGLRRQGLLAGALRMSAAAGAMAAACLLLARALESAVGSQGLPAQLVTGLVPVVVGVVLYGVFSRLLGVPEVDALLQLVRRRGSAPA